MPKDSERVDGGIIPTVPSSVQSDGDATKTSPSVLEKKNSDGSHSKEKGRRKRSKEGKGHEKTKQKELPSTGTLSKPKEHVAGELEASDLPDAGHKTSGNQGPNRFDKMEKKDRGKSSTLPKEERERLQEASRLKKGKRNSKKLAPGKDETARSNSAVVRSRSHPAATQVSLKWKTSNAVGGTFIECDPIFTPSEK